VKQFPNLATLQGGIQLLTGNPSWYATLGNTHVDLRDRVTAYPFVFELGLTSKFSLGIQIPYVTTHSMTFFNVNTTGIQGNLGFNPALAVPAAAAQNAAFSTPVRDRGGNAQASLDACAANPAASPQCPALNANRANANALIANSTRFAGGVNQIYTTSTVHSDRGDGCAAHYRSAYGRIQIALPAVWSREHRAHDDRTFRLSEQAHPARRSKDSI